MGLYTVVITGASGSAYGLRLTEQLLVGGHEVALIMTDVGRRIAAHEVGLQVSEGSEPDEARARVLGFLELDGELSLRVASNADLFDPVSSGSHKVAGMIVVPASMGFVGSIAGGLASSLAERAADVALKEGVPLILVPRETPLNLIQLRNLTTLAEAGAVVLPAMPAFYQRPRTLDDAVDFVVGKVLDVLGLDHGLFQRWGEE